MYFKYYMANHGLKRKTRNSLQRVTHDHAALSSAMTGTYRCQRTYIPSKNKETNQKQKS